MSHTIKVTEGGNHSIKQPAIKIADIKHVKKFDIVITEGLRVTEMFPNNLHCYEQAENENIVDENILAQHS